jgi:valyl-tRNA synthetase
MSDSEFHVATSSLYDFFLNEFCDVYLEYAKLYISGEVLRVLASRRVRSSVH